MQCIYNYLTDDGQVDRKTKGTKKCVIKRERKFKDNKTCLIINKAVLKTQQSFRSEVHNVFTEKT